MAWLSGVIVSRGISHVSAMIFATVSNVEGIGKSLNDNDFYRRAWKRRDTGNDVGPAPVAHEMSRVPV
jgi:hypothetical protein